MRLLFALAPLALVAACATTGPAVDGITPAGVDETVEMTAALRFAPTAVTINSGETVEFSNISTFTHTVSTVADSVIEQQAVKLPAGAAAFDSGPIAPGATFTHTFTTPGTYQYFCQPHVGQGMIGTIIVNP